MDDYRRFVKEQVEIVTEALTRVMFGDLTAAIRSSKADDTFGYLCVMVNVAINAARNATEDYRRLSAELEEQVRVRTAELKEANRILGVEIENRSRLARIVENLPDFVGMADSEGRVLYFNAGARALLGVPSDEKIEGVPIMAFHPPAEVERLEKEIFPYASRFGYWQGESRFLHRDGSEIPVSMTIVASSSPDCRLRYFAAVAHDLRRMRRLEEDLLQSQKLDAIGRLAGGIAHDFNNLLTAIIGYSDLLVSCLSMDDPARLDALEIRKAGERAADLTKQLLAFGRKQILHPEVMDLRAIAGEMYPMLRRLIGEQVEFRLVSDGQPAVILADPGQMSQVIMNLALNARDAMSRGGKLDLEVARSPAAEIVLEVRDNGVGMDAETLSHVFEPFFTTKGVGHGTGLGMATVYGIVTQSGGRIGITSTPGVGTTVRISIPEAAGVPVAPPVSDVVPDLPGEGNILLVEDEIEVRRLLAEQLRRHGYRVTEAESGERALDSLESVKPDLLITDVVMPGLSGPELARACRIRLPDLRVLYVSGYADTGIHSLEDGAAFLSKPFAERVLLARVRRLLA